MMRFTTTRAALLLGGLLCGAQAGAADAEEASASEAPSASHAPGKTRLSDAVLDSITAGTASAADGEDLLTFDFSRTTRSGRTVAADGNLRVLESLEGITIGSLTLSEGAQNDLHSIVNINAVNSAVNVLLNLNISIDSDVGSVHQTNRNAALPVLPPAPRGQ